MLSFMQACLEQTAQSGLRTEVMQLGVVQFAWKNEVDNSRAV